MAEKFVDIVYDLANGTRIPQLGDPQVQDLFAPGGECEKLYSTVYEAKLRLCQQLGEEENADVKIRWADNMLAAKAFPLRERGTAPAVDAVVSRSDNEIPTVAAQPTPHQSPPCGGDSFSSGRSLCGCFRHAKV